MTPEQQAEAEFAAQAQAEAEFSQGAGTIPGPGADNTPSATPRAPGPMQRAGESIAANARRPELGQAGRAFGEGLVFKYGSELSGLGQNAMARMANAVSEGDLEWMGVDNRYPHDPEQFQRDTEREHEAQLARDREASPVLTGLANTAGNFVTATALSPLMPGAPGIAAGNISGTLQGGHQLARAALASNLIGGALMAALDASGGAPDGQREGAAGGAGVLGAALGMGGHYFAPVFNRLSQAARAAPGRLREIAREFAARATGLSPKEMQMLGEDGIQALGAALERSDLAGFTTTLSKLVTRAEGLRRDAGATMGGIVDYADNMARDLAEGAASLRATASGAPSPRDVRLDATLAATDAAGAARAAFRQANPANQWNTPAEAAAVQAAVQGSRTPGMSTTVQSDWGLPAAPSPAPARKPFSRTDYNTLNAPAAPQPSPLGPPNVPPGIEDFQLQHLPGFDPVRGQAHGGEATPLGPPNINSMGIPLPGVVPERPLQFGFDARGAAGEMEAAFLQRYGNAPAVMNPAMEVGRREAESLRALGSRPTMEQRSGLYGASARNQPVTFREAQTRVADLGRATSWTPDPSTPDEALQLARNSLAGSVESQLANLDTMGGTGLVPQYRVAKEQFGHMADAHTAGSRTLNARQKATESVDPTALGSMQRGYHRLVGNPMSQAAAATRFAATSRASPVTPAANTTAFIAEMLGTNPAAYGVFAAPLQKALQAGGETALGQEFKLLYDSMPGFRMMIRSHEEEQGE